MIILVNTLSNFGLISISIRPGTIIMVGLMNTLTYLFTVTTIKRSIYGIIICTRKLMHHRIVFYKDQCTICYDKIHTQPFILEPCGHKFHTYCMKTWLIKSKVSKRRRARCVLCQQFIVFKQLECDVLFNTLISGEK